MAGNGKTKRKYDPRRSLSAALRVGDRWHARQPLSDAQMRDLGIAYHVAFDLMRSGRGDEESWSTLACMTNIAVVFAEQGMGKEHLAALLRALEGIRRAKVRADASGRWAFDGDALAAIEHGLRIHDAQMEIATVGETRAVLAEVERRIGRKIGTRPTPDKVDNHERIAA